MKLFRFDAAVGRVIEAYGSSEAVHARIVRTTEPMSIGCIYLGAGGVAGYHPTTKNQLFVVVQGSGWVRGQDEQRTPIAAGQAAFWEGGEFHESGTEAGMTAMVIEGDGLDPAKDIRSADDGR